MKNMNFISALGLALAFSFVTAGSSHAAENNKNMTILPDYGFQKPLPPCGDKMWIAVYPKPCVDAPPVVHHPKPLPPCGDKIWPQIYPKPCVDAPSYPHRPVRDLDDKYGPKGSADCRSILTLDPNHPCVTGNRPPPRYRTYTR